MSLNQVTIMEIAKENVKKHYGFIMPVVLFVVLVPSLFTALFEDLTFLTYLIYAPIPFGLATILLNLTSGKNCTFSDLFKGYSQFWKLFFIQFLVSIWVFLGLIVFVIPGVIFALQYSLVWFVLADNPSCTILGALKQSKEMMEGNKMDLFRLLVGFIGWLILSAFTGGLLFLFYVGPYMYFAMAEFYRTVSKTKVDVIDVRCEDEENVDLNSDLGGVRD
ncbi:MAG: DUF975 family protein [Candidatus Zophobacter franzmannii]|nr:DUF975 family protein [Candidatus Zophobacter franzmannii]